MEPVKIKLEKKYVTGISAVTNNKNESDFENAKIPGLWNDFMYKNLYDKIPGKTPESRVYAVYTNYISDHNDDYKIIVGAEVKDGSEPGEFGKVCLDDGDYYKFNVAGKFPEAIIKAWGDIWNYFEKNKDVKRAYSSDFEEYISEEELNIYISVR